jgi:hypothetical protein
MANKKISELDAATTPLAGTEVIPIVQAGATKNVAVSVLVTDAVSAALTNDLPRLHAVALSF